MFRSLHQAWTLTLIEEHENEALRYLRSHGLQFDIRSPVSEEDIGRLAVLAGPKEGEDDNTEHRALAVLLNFRRIAPK